MHRIVEEIRRIRRNDRFEVIEEDDHEAVYGLATQGAACGVGFGEGGGPVE